MNRSAIILPLGLLMFATGCPKPETACTNDLRSSITLNVFDEFGDAIDAAMATYSVDGSAVEDCDAFGDGTMSCGNELGGEFTVTVDAQGFTPEVFVQFVDQDKCHVITEHVDVTLSPTACTANIVPSVQVTVTDSLGQDVTSGDVTWNMADEDDLPEPCFYQNNVWNCGEEVAGELIIEINNADFYAPYAQVVTVDADDCHVITEQLAAVLEFLPDY
ncbi:MAG: hypothetical protein GWP91_10175 [Rhodobacterales bacterium]|nr:hypothetical protein [Rhodobacterales bacterium]